MARQGRQQQRRSSMSTMFEFRARPWLVRSLLAVLLGAIGFATTYLLTH